MNSMNNNNTENVTAGPLLFEYDSLAWINWTMPLSAIRQQIDEKTNLENRVNYYTDYEPFLVEVMHRRILSKKDLYLSVETNSRRSIKKTLHVGKHPMNHLHGRERGMRNGQSNIRLTKHPVPLDIIKDRGVKSYHLDVPMHLPWMGNYERKMRNHATQISNRFDTIQAFMNLERPVHMLKSSVAALLMEIDSRVYEWGRFFSAEQNQRGDPMATQHISRLTELFRFLLAIYTKNDEKMALTIGNDMWQDIDDRVKRLAVVLTRQGNRVRNKLSVVTVFFGSDVATYGFEKAAVMRERVQTQGERNNKQGEINELTTTLETITRPFNMKAWHTSHRLPKHEKNRLAQVRVQDQKEKQNLKEMLDKLQKNRNVLNEHIIKLNRRLLQP